MADHLYSSSLDSTRKEVRLSRILWGNDNEPLRCTLHQASLTADLVFNVLSYCWGAPQPADEVIIDGVALSATANLTHAWAHFRRSNVAIDVPIWIDALCINQRNTQEQNSQVAMMGDIQRSAATVHIWLGKAVERTGMHAIAVRDPAFLRVPQELFTRFRHCQATDPRDKVYGMPGLLPGVLDITPDYSKSTTEVFQEATLQLMDTSNDLEMMVKACTGSPDLPAWLLDFRVPSRTPVYFAQHLISRRAGTSTKMQKNLHGPGMLRTRGIPIDRVADIERAVGQHARVETSWPKQHIGRRWQLFEHYAVHRNAQSQVNALDRHFEFWCAACGGAVDQADFDDEEMERCQELMRHWAAHLPGTFVDSDLVDYLCRVVRECDFFVTATGDAGLTAKDAVNIGEDILVLAGSPTPFCATSTLKASQDSIQTYILKAPCFVENVYKDVFQADGTWKERHHEWRRYP